MRLNLPGVVLVGVVDRAPQRRKTPTCPALEVFLGVDKGANGTVPGAPPTWCLHGNLKVAK